MNGAAQLMPERIVIVGFARTGEAVARVCAGRGVTVVAIDDRPTPEAEATAASLAIDLRRTPDGAELTALLAGAGLVVVSPGVPPWHPVFAAAAPGTAISEIEFASRLGGPPIVAVTGTNGKTTVTSLVASILERSGLSARAAGNIGYPLVAAVIEPGLDLVVAEVSSFQLSLTTSFSPAVAGWLNFAADHLDWHRDLDEYASAKARIWANQRPGDVVVANLDDPVVMAYARRAPGRLVTFGRAVGDFRVADGALVAPDGQSIAIDELRRAMPHDVMNALAALALAMNAGATWEAARDALRAEQPLHHRVELVATVGGVGFYDDSKATTPSAVAAALQGFTSVVLIAGGRNKGLDLGAIAAAADAGLERGAPSRLRAVVAIGEAADEVRKAFAPSTPVVDGSSMADAVQHAAGLAVPGDAVLLSPGCASFDWYRSYEERGDDFAQIVRTLAADEARR